MADLTSADVTINRAWTEGGVHGKDLSGRQVTLVLGGQGGGTNKIPASVLGLTTIEQAGTFVGDADDKVYPATPSYDGSQLLLVNLADATDATRIAPADITDTIRGVVKGYL